MIAKVGCGGIRNGQGHCKLQGGEHAAQAVPLLHLDARLTEADWKSVCDWSMDEADRLGRRQP